MNKESRLLTEQEFVAEFKKMEEANTVVNMPWMWGKQVAQAQDTKSVKARDKEWVEWLNSLGIQIIEWENKWAVRVLDVANQTKVIIAEREALKRGIDA